MKKILVKCLIVLIAFTAVSSVEAKRTDILIKNKLFSVSLPQNFRKSFSSKVMNDCILIYDKESAKAGFGGFAFGINAYKYPAEHAEMPGGKKIGELTDKRGHLYDVVLIHPTDVQYDYTKSSEAPESYKNLYNHGDNITIQGVSGSTYYKSQGMKGDDLYKDILKKHIIAIQDKWDSTKLEKENMSPMYNVVTVSGKNAMDKIGYKYYDVNGDGIEELLIGEVVDGEWKGIVYDMYTMVDRKPQHVASGWSRNRYFICNGTFVCNEYSSGAKESGTRVYILLENSTNLFPQVSFKYDGYANQKNPCFLSYGDDKWENVSEATLKERKKVFEEYKRFDYIPLRNYVK